MHQCQYRFLPNSSSVGFSGRGGSSSGSEVGVGVGASARTGRDPTDNKPMIVMAGRRMVMIALLFMGSFDW